MEIQSGKIQNNIICIIIPIYNFEFSRSGYPCSHNKRAGISKIFFEAIKILAPFMKNPNSPNGFGETPIQYARRFYGSNQDVIQILETLQWFWKYPKNS